MKLYMHPVSNTSRPVRLYIAEHNLPVEEEVVDLFTGAHYQEPYATINPAKMVPLLEDGDFRMGESSAILKYLGNKFDLADYPKDPQKRGRIDERMDFLNTQFYRDFACGLVYPQLFPHHKRESDVAQQGTLDWGKKGATKWFQIINDHFLGDHKFIAGDEMTIADYFGVSLVTVGECIRCDFSQWPNVARWVADMKQLKSWAKVNESFYGYVKALENQPFVAL